jgi:NAD(P)-dependent dehydrogenase (short-subunit alcohol dehydrogenase family)
MTDEPVPRRGAGQAGRGGDRGGRRQAVFLEAHVEREDEAAAFVRQAAQRFGRESAAERNRQHRGGPLSDRGRFL